MNFLVYVSFFYSPLLYKRVSLMYFYGYLYSMFIPTRFILCNKVTEILIVSHDLFRIHGK